MRVVLVSDMSHRNLVISIAIFPSTQKQSFCGSLRIVSMAPGPRLQSINARLHREPLATIAYTAYWSGLLVLATPVCVVTLLARAASKIWKSLTATHEWHYYEPTKDSNTQLAVFITGCDTGFGKEIALVAASKGFFVFAGCLQAESFQQFQGMDNITPLLVDVTSDKQVQDAANVVQEWIQAGEKEPNTKRVLHAILNNAGIGVCGLVDWLPLSAFQKVMDGKNSAFEVHGFKSRRFASLTVCFFPLEFRSQLLWHPSRLPSLYAIAQASGHSENAHWCSHT